MQYTPHQKRRSDARCDIIISRGLRRTSPCSARHPHKGDRALGVILSPEDCNLQACAAHAKQKKGDRTHVRSPFVLRTLRPYQHGALDLQTNARTWHGSCKTHRTRAEIPTNAPLGQGGPGIRHSAAIQLVNYKSPQKSGPHLSVQPVVESPCSFN